MSEVWHSSARKKRRVEKSHEHSVQPISSLRCGFSAAVKAIVFLAACTATSGMMGCLVPLPTTVKPTSEEQGIVTGNQSGEKSAGLIRPTIPSDKSESSIGRDQSTGTAPRKPTAQASTKAGSKGPPEEEWEDQKVKNAALKIAGTFPSVLKIRVCYTVDEDEWWVTLYNDINTAIDLKQYIWSREEEQLKPYLVLKRIPRGQLNSDLARKHKGTACEVIDPPGPASLSGAPTQN